MGYFSNGTSNEIYMEEYCSRCVHQKLDDGGCSVMFLHFLHNYDECNNKESMLHVLIPRDGLKNEECTMFHPVDPDRCGQTPDMFRPTCKEHQDDG